MADKSVHLAPNAGTVLDTMNFAVQQVAAQATGVIQKIPLSGLVETGLMADLTDDVKFVTPAAFTATVGTDLKAGTLKVAQTSTLLSKSDADIAVVCSNIAEMFTNEIPLPTAISTFDIDAASDGVDSSLALYKSTFGNRATIEGTLTFVPNVSTDTLEIYINNITQPFITQCGFGYVSSASNPNENWAMGILIESVGAPTPGGGQIRLTMGRDNTNWSSGATYYIKLGLNYSAII